MPGDWESSQLLLFLAFFVPGFISIKVFDLLVPAERRDFRSSLIEAIGYSSINFALLLPMILWLVSALAAGAEETGWTSGALRLLAWYIIILAAPVLWPFLYVKIVQPRFSKIIRNPIAKPWDVVFSPRREVWIILHLKNGRRIGGRYAKYSEASSYPAPEQLYVKEVWKLDENGAFIERVDRTGGLLISMEHVEAIEFFE